MWDNIVDAVGQKLSGIDYTQLVSKGIGVLLTLIIAAIVIRSGNFIIQRVMEAQSKRKFPMDEKRINTLISILKSILRYAVYFIAIVTILDTLGVPVSSLIAAAGIGGLAIGFGAQNLVKDVITGFFILFEDQFAVGDYVSIDGINGTVQDIGLRVTKIQGFAGDVNIIPNGSIAKVANFTRGNNTAIVDVTVSYETNLDKTIVILEEVGRAMREEHPEVQDTPKVLGVVNLGDNGVTLRIIAKTLPMNQWAVERELRKRIKEAFEKEGIEIPYPKTVIIPQVKKA
ncbi:mechanosensitive ion channel family protein [Mahella australiensis]|uniref:MscS Mechanosensitive ion channel n=1 Tax=Mahella australiensis (strain DSM 15567 / CIP 107919 / 50-1 BON) TaxID=697281 RepID=F3ZXQ9_MAHA5|nr:mechanosensitive ion channel family protein [Mahella australiensis]AEE95566.1 MscS Mechanosensitive ion channel [Mahella australiensis 50-1 BON]